MKYRKNSLGVMILLNLFLLSAASAATSDPVGAMAISIKGNDGATIISSGGFTRSVQYQGVGDVASARSFEDLDALWTTDAYAGTHYVQLSTGEWSSIESNTATVLSLGSDLPLSTAVEFKIIPFNTLDGMFGVANSAGFTGGENLSLSDLLLPWDAESQSYAGLYYYNSSRNRWEDVNNNNAGGAILYPDESLVIVGRTDKEILLSGAVQKGSSSGFVVGYGATSIIPNPYPIDVLISESNLENSISGGSDFGNSDWLFVWDHTSQSYSSYYYFDTDDGLWKDLGNNVVTNSDVIPAGYGVILVKNSPNNTAWYMNQPFSD